MSMSDNIADALTRIRNAQQAHHESVEIVMTKTVESIIKLLKSEGFIEGYSAFKKGASRMAKINLKYYEGTPLIRGIERMSKPGRRLFLQWKEIRPYLNSVGLGIYSTPKGIVTDKDAKDLHVGGEYICRVW